MNEHDLSPQQDYQNWLSLVKGKYQRQQIRAATSVNRAMLEFYWGLGRDIVERNWENVYGSGFFKKLSNDLKDRLDNPKGFSENNLRYMRAFYRLYSPLDQKLQQLVGDFPLSEKQTDFSVSALFSIPWGHHVQIINKCNGNLDKALFYIRKCLEYNWSRAVLMNFLDTDLYEREGKAITNFQR